MLIKNQESGLTLPHAPEFGPDGTWPSAQTEWLPLRWQVFTRDASDLAASVGWMFFVANPPLTSDDTSFREFCHDPAALASIMDLGAWKDGVSVGLTNGQEELTEFRMHSISAFDRKARGVSMTVAGGTSRSRRYQDSYPQQVQQLEHSVRWRREDPPTQLPPAATYELTHTVTTGLSIERSQTLAKSLGLDLGVQELGLQAKLSEKLQQQFGLKFNINEAEETSRKLTLTNPNDDCYRVFSLWQVDHQLTVKVLNVKIEIYQRKLKPTRFHHIIPRWELRDQAQFVISNQPFITYADIGRS